MTDVTFPDGTSLTPPYAVPASDWAVIDDRVAITIEMQNVAPEIEKYIPNYPDLLQACTTWRSATWSGLIVQAVNTETFATQAAKVLGQLSSDLTGIQPTDPVPHSVSFIFTVQFHAMAQTAGQQAGTASGLADQLEAFVSANQATDAALEKVPLGGWSPIAGPIKSLQAATADLQTGWGSMTSQLQALSATGPKVTTAGLLASNLATAIRSWQTLATTTGAFVTMAAHLGPDSAS